ncbi:hypothetical protein R1T16_13415 [Flavobacterium sp. DG1-102-2]|uniref:hypothetical protein n=1 Tax=Flavobacterium sp. DG1-102-2 TaxID=3081663 RepID=UPI0029490EDB|nr:hypothetical protein [Flavobacterium sp. DG1-102-2]MDV6169428.1 hypothetical protein [Flavobacterium sp. DG1-102-2]
MKKITLTLIALLGMNAVMTAQETTTDSTSVTKTRYVHNSKDRFNFYYGFGVNVFGDYKLNDKLKPAQLPTIGTTAPEITVGFNYMPSDSHFYHDLELAVAYMDDKTSANRIKTAVTSFRIRPHYKIIDNTKMFFSAGIDGGIATTILNLYSRGNRIDLNNPNPGTHTGHINMNSTQFILGPSVALALFQDSFPVRINAGYNIGLSRGRWKSDVAEVDNAVKESGLGNFYAKVLIGF